jgi:hypothetical protein
VELAPLRRGRPWWLLLAALPIAAAFAVAYALQRGSLAAPAARAAVPATAPPASSATLAKGVSVPFEVCYYNGKWAPPAPDVQGEHLEGDPRYRQLATAPVLFSPERVHVEVGPYRSTSAFTDFVQLSGLWTDPNATASACPADLQGKVELWALELHVQRFELTGQDLAAYAEPQPAGVEVTQVAIPDQAVALHVLNGSGAKLAPDVNLRG